MSDIKWPEFRTRKSDDKCHANVQRLLRYGRYRCFNKSTSIIMGIPVCHQHYNSLDKRMRGRETKEVVKLMKELCFDLILKRKKHE